MIAACVFDGGKCVRCGADCINERQVCGVGNDELLGLIDEFAATPTRGPGTELKKLLARVGITATPDCDCNARAAEMDRREQDSPGWCEANLDTIVGWLREQAEARGLPFLDAVGRLLVLRAIRNARKAAPPSP